MSAPQSGPDSGGDLFDMAKDGTTVPEDSAKPRLIPSKPRPDQIPSEPNPNDFGDTSLAGAAANEADIPRSTRDLAGTEVLTGTGDAMPGHTDTKRLHAVPGGVVHNPEAKGSTRRAAHVAEKRGGVDPQPSDGPYVDRAPGMEDLDDQEAMDQVDTKVET